MWYDVFCVRKSIREAVSITGFFDALKGRPVIAAARDSHGALLAAKGSAAAVFLLGGSIMTLPQMVRDVKDAGKCVFVHLDLLEGLGHDAAAVEWCARFAAPDGLISTRAPLLKQARACGLLTIQRLFVMDKASLTHGVKQLRLSGPDLIEVLPGLVPKAVSALVQAMPGTPVIAGGMVTERSEVRAALDAGAVGVSTSEQALWALTREEISRS